MAQLSKREVWQQVSKLAPHLTKDKKWDIARQVYKALTFEIKDPEEILDHLQKLERAVDIMKKNDIPLKLDNLEEEIFRCILQAFNYGLQNHLNANYGTTKKVEVEISYQQLKRFAEKIGLSWDHLRSFVHTGLSPKELLVLYPCPI
jgi:hypothetical protein